MVNVKHLWENDKPLFFKFIKYSQSIIDVHASTLADHLPHTINLQNLQNPLLVQHIQTYLRHKLNLNSFPIKQLESPLKEWLFLPTSTLLNLQHFIGALRFSRNIKTSVQKWQHKQLIELLGESIYTCILKRASLFFPHLPMHLFSECSGNNMIDNILSTGQLAIEYCLFDCHPDLLKRFTLKFPSNMTWDFNLQVSTQDQIQLISLCNSLITKKLV